MLRKWMLVLGVACAAVVCPAARADTLVLSDGRKLTGAVTAEGETYTVKTRFGDVTVNKADVSNWQRDGGGDAAAAATTAPAPAAATTAPTSDPATQKGIDALAAGDFPAARDLLADALRHDPRDARAAHGLGLAYLKLGDVVRARDLLAQALRDSPAPDRALTINAAAVELAAGNAMRAVRIARDYLAAHPGDVDEPVLDAMGIALNLTDDRTRAAAAYREAADFYDACQSKLQAAHPGQKRWGIHWLPAAEVKRKDAHPMTAQREKLRALHDAEALAEKRVSVAQAQLERVQKAGGAGGSNVESELARRTLADAQAKRDAARAAAEAAADDERAPFPDHIVTVALDEPAPGAGPPPQATRAAPVEVPPAVIADAGPTTSAPPAATASSPAPPASPAGDAAPSGSQYAAAFPVAPNLLLTAARPLRNAKRITVTGGDGIPQKAVLLRADDATTGLALLKVDGVKLSPLAFHPAFAGGPIDCAAFPTLDVFSPSAAIIHGTAAPAPPPPARGAKEAWTVKLEQDPRLPGAPFLADGRVVGIELGAADGAVETVPAVSAARAAAFVGADLAPGESSADPCGVMMQVTVTHAKD